MLVRARVLQRECDGKRCAHIGATERDVRDTAEDNVINVERSIGAREEEEGCDVHCGGPPHCGEAQRYVWILQRSQWVREESHWERRARCVRCRERRDDSHTAYDNAYHHPFI